MVLMDRSVTYMQQDACAVRRDIHLHLLLMLCQVQFFFFLNPNLYTMPSPVVSKVIPTSWELSQHIYSSSSNTLIQSAPGIRFTWD